MKKILVIMFAMLITVTLAACGGSDEPVAIVNDEEIMESEWEEQVDIMFAMYENMYEQYGMDFEDIKDDDEFIENVETEALEYMIQEAVLLQAAEKEGIETTDSDVDRVFEERRDIFENNYKPIGFTEESYRDTIRTELTIESYFDKHLVEVEVDEEAIQDMYEQQKEQYEEQGQEVPDFDEIEDQLEQQYIVQKEQEQMQEIYDELYETSEIERLI